MPDTVSAAPPNQGEARVLALETLRSLGAELNIRRRRFRVPIAALANSALTTRQTVARIERGDPRVAVGTWASVVAALELNAEFRAIVTPERPPGTLRLSLDTQNRLFPKRVRRRKYEQ